MVCGTILSGDIVDHTNVPILKYDLPDMAFFQRTDTVSDAFVHIPAFRSIVLGRGSDPAQAFHPETVAADGIPVYKRPSGGETVILSPETLVLAVVRTGIKLSSPHRFFKLYSDAIIGVLARNGIQNACQRGISDVSVGPLKVLGSSIYWHRDRLLYHAVLNVNEPVENLERYLKHPPREPDYRKGRTHGDFVTTLRACGCETDMILLGHQLETALREAN